MKKQMWHLVIVTFMSSLCAVASFASVGKVIIAKGDTFAIDATSNSRLLSRRSDILEGDTLITGANSEIHIRFEDNAVLALRADSKLKINEYHSNSNGQAEQVLMELLSGGFRTISGSFGKSDKDAYQIRTPNASIGIRGTNYEAVLSGNRLIVGVYQGGISLKNQFGSMNLGIDSAFSFAQVSGQSASFEGLLEAPAELSAPLTTSFNAAPTENDEASEEVTANVQNEDDELLVENLFDDETTPLRPADKPETTVTTGTLADVAPPATATQVVDKIASTSNLSQLQDVRLTQEQIRLLQDKPKVGFVVVNEDPAGYRKANYQLSFAFNNDSLIYPINDPVSFDISYAGKIYQITLTNFNSYSSPGFLAGDITNQISNQIGTIDETLATPVISVTYVDGSLVFSGYSDQSNSSIKISNFTGTGAEPTNVAAALGLCDNATITCAGEYDLGAPTAGNYDSAVHFGYMIPGKNGPVFVNYKNESITALLDGYKAPDNILRGNANALLTEFTAVDTNYDAQSATSTGTNIVKWGYWNTSASNPALLLKDAKNIAISETIDSPFFYVVAPPAKAADMVGEKTLSTIVDWHATSSTTTGMQHYSEGQSCNDSSSTCLTAMLAVNFTNAAATGTLDFSNSIDNWSWQLKYYGKVKGAQFFSEYGYGTLNDDGSTHDAVGHVDGLFTSASSGLGFVGGFGLQTTDDQFHSQGVFIIK